MFFPAGPQRPGILTLLIPLLGTGLLALPLGYLFVRALQGDLATLLELVFRSRNLELLANTLILVILVVVLTFAMAMPLAWLTERSGLKRRKLWALVSLAPMAIPGYVMAYTLLSIGGHYGFAARVLGLDILRPSGLLGSAIALALYTYPYFYINLRTSLNKMDPALEESARSMGLSSSQVFVRVILPQLGPAIASASLVVSLYVLGDFGVVSLMRYQTLSLAVYLQYSAAYERVYAAILSIILVGIAAVLLGFESKLLGTSGNTGNRNRRPPVQYRLGKARLLLYLWAAIVLLFALVLPLVMLAYWIIQNPDSSALPRLGQVFFRSFSLAFPAAALAVLIATPTVYLAYRYRSGLSRGLEAAAKLGYGIPPIALGLGFVFFSLGTIFYQKAITLIAAYALNFLALALGPIRASLLQSPARIEESARSLGYPPGPAFRHAVLPSLLPGLAASGILVFVAAMKELPISLLLAPTGYTTLAMTVYSRTSEAMFAQAAPFAAGIVLFSSLFLGLILRYEGTDHAST